MQKKSVTNKKKERRDMVKREMSIALIKEIEQNGEWLDSVYPEVRTKHLNRFIAIKNKTIIAESDSFEELVEILKSKNEDLDKVLIEFMHGRGFEFIL